MNNFWHILDDPTQIHEIKTISESQKVLIFKHSTTCNISRMALKTFESDWDASEMADLKPYYLDLKAFRAISNQIAEDFQVHHESPQVLLISKGVAVYDASHEAIDYEAIKNFLGRE